MDNKRVNTIDRNNIWIWEREDTPIDPPLFSSFLVPLHSYLKSHQYWKILIVQVWFVYIFNIIMSWGKNERYGPRLEKEIITNKSKNYVNFSWRYTFFDIIIKIIFFFWWIVLRVTFIKSLLKKVVELRFQIFVRSY